MLPIGLHFGVAQAGVFAHFVRDVAPGGLPDQAFPVEPAEQSSVAASHVDDSQSVVARNGVFFREAALANLADDFQLVQFLRLPDLLLAGELGLVVVRDEVVPSDVELVLAPNLGVEILRVFGIVVSLGVGGGGSVEPDEDGQGIAPNVGGSGLAVVVFLDYDGNVHVVGSQQLLNLQGCLPVRRVVGGRQQGAFLPVDVLVDLEFSAQLWVFLVVVHDGVREEVSVPVGDHAESLGTGHGDHLVHDSTAEFVGHDVEGVVDANDQGLAESLRVSLGNPPVVELEGVCDHELAGFVGVLGLAKVDEFLVDVHPDAGNGDQLGLVGGLGGGVLHVARRDGGSNRLLGVHFSDDVTGSAPDLEDAVVSALLGRLAEGIDGGLVGGAKDGCLVGNGFVPVHGRHEFPDLALGVVGNLGHVGFAAGERGVDVVGDVRVIVGGLALDGGTA
mmetsp:Transcript_6740/g.15305  ORF Transcript_6740/g.15305 Transcript_6740/m.15305 type:complete len:446 (-) Transcript_6740:480-1817(-)